MGEGRTVVRLPRAAVRVAALLAIVLVAGAVRPAAAPDTIPTVAVSAVETVGMTVGDMNRALDFYTRVLPFERRYDVEVSGREWEQLHGVFGARLRIVGLQLGDERLELTQYLTPQGRPMPADTRGNDRWFQHVAIIVRDMDAAYAHLRASGVAHASTGPQRLPDWNPVRRRHPGVLLPRPGRTLPRDPVLSAGQGRSEMASTGARAVPRPRPHRHRRRGHRLVAGVLPRHARLARGGRG